MTKVFVLLYIVTANSGAATSTVEFGSLGECERAGRQLQDHFSSVWRTVSYICVEKMVTR